MNEFNNLELSHWYIYIHVDAVAACSYFFGCDCGFAQQNRITNAYAIHPKHLNYYPNVIISFDLEARDLISMIYSSFLRWNLASSQIIADVISSQTFYSY